MSDLTFEVVGVAPDRYAAVPTIAFKLRLTENSGDPVHALALRTQIMIEPQRRRYTHEEEDRLLALFGETNRWGQTLKPFLWTNISTMIPGFEEVTEVDLLVPCTYDFELASAKYLHSVETAEVPLNFLFSGTIISKGDTGFTVEPVPWSKESRFGLPGSVWRAVMDLFFPGTGWMRVRRETLDALERFRTVRGLPTWDQAFEALLKESEAAAAAAEPETAPGALESDEPTAASPQEPTPSNGPGS